MAKETSGSAVGEHERLQAAAAATSQAVLALERRLEHERRRRELQTIELLREQEQRTDRERVLALQLRLALQASQLGFWQRQVDDGRFFWDARMLEIHGLGEPPSQAEALAMVVSEDIPKLRRLWANVSPAEAARPRSAEYRIRKPDGSRAHLRAYAIRSDPGQGHPAMDVGVVADVTAEVQAAEQRLQAEGQWREMRRLESIATIAGGVAHNFNNLLAGMMGAIELAMDSPGTDPREVELLRAAQRSGLKARDLIRALMLFARRAPPGARQRVELGHLVRETVALFAASVPATLAVRLELGPGEFSIEAEESRLQQAILNLCLNAAEAIGDRPGSLTVSVEAIESPADGARGGPYVRVTVNDNGRGIEPEHLPRIFDPFFSTKPAHEGRGLGLSVAQGIVADLQGRIVVESTVGVGSRFEVWLPLQPASRSAAGAVPVGRAAWAGRRVLTVVEDDYTRQVLALLLARLGLVTEEAAGREAGRERFTRAPDSFHLVLWDDSLPGRPGDDGWQPIRRLRPNLPILVFTELAGIVPEAAGRRQDPRLFHLPKPFTHEELVTGLSRALPT